MNARKMTPIAITVVCLALTGCASPGAATPTAAQPSQPTPIPSTAALAPTETPQPTATPAATSTPAPTVAPDQPTQAEPPTPENTPVPTATSYPAPAVPLSPTGPWLVFRANGYLWAINQDGTGLTRLINEPVVAFAVQPTSSVQSGLTIAYVTADYDSQFSRFAIAKSSIKIFSWPGGDVRTIVHRNVSEKYLSLGYDGWNYSDLYPMGLVWSPTGGKLAFVSAMEDASFNVFVYDAVTEQITRIAVTEEDDYRLRWSPDERYVIFETWIFGMSGPTTDALWSARADAGGVTVLASGSTDQLLTNDLGWLDPTEMIRITWWIHDAVDITNVETGDQRRLVREPDLSVAYSPEHNLFLMTAEGEPSPDRLLIFYQNGERQDVAGYAIKTVQWLNANDVFLGQTSDGHAYLIRPDGVVTEVFTPEWSVDKAHQVMVSPNGQWWAWHYADNYEFSELWVGPAMAQPSIDLSHSLLYYRAPVFLPDYDHSAANMKWSPDSQYLLWLTKNGLFVTQPPDFEAVLVTQLPGNREALIGEKWDFVDFSDAVWVQ